MTFILGQTEYFMFDRGFDVFGYTGHLFKLGCRCWLGTDDGVRQSRGAEQAKGKQRWPLGLFLEALWAVHPWAFGPIRASLARLMPASASSILHKSRHCSVKPFCKPGLK